MDRPPTIEEALRESEARFRALFSAIDEGYCLCEIVRDATGAAVDYRFLEANPVFEAMTGLVDPVGRTAYELVPDLEPHWVETYAAAAEGGEPLRFQQGSAAMGRVFDVFVTGVEPRGRFAVVFTDVTQRELAELARSDGAAAERRARVQAELLAELDQAIGTGAVGQADVQRLADRLVSGVADVARVELPGPDGPVAAVATRTPDSPRRVEDADVRAEAEVDAGTGARGTVAIGLSGVPQAEADAFARRVCEHVGTLVARARLREEEHEIALRLQQALLPSAVLRTGGVEIDARYAAASDLLEVGGDFFDTLALRDGWIGLTVGDVVGHGLEAAATMGRLRTALAALAPHASGPGQLLSHLDAYASGPNAVGFATVCVAALEPATGRLLHASAGHPPMLVVTAEGEARWLEAGLSPPLHDAPLAGRVQSETTLEPGALLVLFSDGLVERRGESLHVGLEQLRAAATAGRALPPGALCDHLIAELGTAEAREDDVAVLVLRRDR